MSKRFPKTVLTCALALAALALPAGEAGANRSQLTIIQHDADLLRDPDLRNRRLDEFRALGVEVVKLRMDWRTLAPDGDRRPDGFDATNPASYPADRWAPYDEAIKGIASRGMRPYIMLGGRAPEWATAGRGNVDRPNGDEFRQWVQAVGTRYSGTYGGQPGYMDPLGGGSPATGALPRVDIWGIWNEPNLLSWLAPQYRRGLPYSPRVYRGLVYGAFDGLSASGHGSDSILIGELLPFARSGRTRDKVRPVQFLRELACVDSRYRPYTGRSARSRGCSNFRPIPGNGLAYHPYTLSGGPRVRSPHRDDASISELSRITRALSLLDRRRRLATRRMPIWISEFGYQTDPPDRLFGSRISRVPGFMGESEWIAFRNSRVASYAQYLLVDDPVQGSGAARYAGFQTGLRFSNGEAKPGVYAAFELPFFVRRRSSSRVEVFGGVRAGAEGDQVVVEQRLGRGDFRELGTVALGTNGYFLRTFSLSRADRREYRFRWRDRESRRARAARR